MNLFLHLRYYLSKLFKIRSISDANFRENQTHILCATTSSRNRAVCDIMWKNMVEPDWPQMRLITKATHTQTHT